MLRVDFFKYFADIRKISNLYLFHIEQEQKVKRRACAINHNCLLPYSIKKKKQLLADDKTRGCNVYKRERKLPSSILAFSRL